jgi:HPP family protein
LTDSAVAAKWPNFLLPAGLSGTVLAAIGALGWLAGIPWLLPSLGPTLAIQTSTPLHASARMRNVAFGHGIGLAAGLLAVFLTGAAHAPAVMDMVKDTLSLERVAASVIAVALSLAVQHRFKLTHPPAEATTLIVALGGVEPTPAGALTVVAAIALVTVLGEAARRLSARTPALATSDCIHGELSRPVLKSPPAYSAARRG